MKFSELIKNEIPFYFEKWGDGEFYTIKLRQEEQYQNCDGDKYTKKFSTDLLKALEEIEKDSENHYIGQWLYHKEVYDFFNQYKFNFVNFHRFMFYEGDYEEKIEIFRNIKNSKLKKVYVCNKDLQEKLKPLLNIDDFLIIPKNNWYDEKGEEVFEKLKLLIDRKSIVLFSCGSADHILINKLKQYNRNNILISIGSGFDWYATGKSTRSQELTKDEYFSIIEKIKS